MATRIRTICLIHCSLAGAFAGLGLTVTSLDPPAGTASLPSLLADLPEPPDCVIHQEHLGKRFILTDIDAAPCPTIFWACDPHLNFFWQRHYACQFTATASTQPQLTQAFAASGAAHTAWITWHGHKRPFIPFARRRNTLAFVGRLTPNRRRRQWFADHLAAYGLVPSQAAYGEAMAAVYDDARLAPNECIAGEVNQRLFEAAGSGCLPLSERTPEGVAELFVPDREALYYDDVLELDGQLAFAAAHPGVIEKMAQAAHAAVGQRHLAEHRAAALLALAGQAANAPGSPATGPDAAAATALTLFALFRSDQMALPQAAVWERLAGAPITPAVAAAMLRLAGQTGQRPALAHLAGLCLGRPELAGDVQTAAAACLACCRLNDLEGARRAYAAYVGAAGKTRAARLDTHYDYLVFFAAALEGKGHGGAPGMVFDPDQHVPENAVECLQAAKLLRPDALEADRRLAAVLRRRPGTQAERVGLLSTLSLYRRNDWSLGLELGLTNLHAFRREPGIEEAIIAAEAAAAQGQLDRFSRRLAQADPAGRLRAALLQHGIHVPDPGIIP
ncbi:glycosyltransferase [Desulfovibrio aerotolerans]|uniref:Glycosyltransferase n=2 Tax=Solidesulfovibrio aerotolerans TaxID=295255 RepID=A0A7C9IUB0_9BACT|nr:glycosyltransferase [Solidesulfovibrio aerotolerans]